MTPDTGSTEGRLSAIRQPFRKRIRSHEVVSWLAYRVSRTGLLVATALVPALALAAAAVFGPRGLAEAISEPQNVHEAFSRLAGVVAVASSIAVSVAALALRRELRGMSAVRKHHEADLQFREDVRNLLGLSHVPLGLAGILDTLLKGVQDQVEHVRAVADAPTRRGISVDDVPLDDFLRAVEVPAARMRRGLRRGGKEPKWLLDHVLDFELRTTESLAAGFARETDLPEDLDEVLDALNERVRALVTAINYTKTLTMQWELGRMSFTILLSAFPAILASVLLVLAYDTWVVTLLGVQGAAVVVSAVFGLSLVPLTAFGSHLTRIVFLNQFALPTAGFGLGPEEPESLRGELSSRTGRGAGGGPA